MDWKPSEKNRRRAHVFRVAISGETIASVFVGIEMNVLKNLFGFGDSVVVHFESGYLGIDQALAGGAYPYDCLAGVAHAHRFTECRDRIVLQRCDSTFEIDELYRKLVRCVDTAFSNSWDTPWRLSAEFAELFLGIAQNIPVLRGGESRVTRRLDVAVEGDWSVSRSTEEAAGLLGLSRSELYRQFQDEEECSPAEWMRRQRIELAKNHLRDGLNVAEVADLLNFSSPYALSRMFKEVTGMRPKKMKSS